MVRVRVLIVGVCCAFFGLGLGACAKSIRTQSPTDTDREPYRFESEGQAPLPAAMPREVDRVDIFEETPVSDSALAVESVEPVQEISPEDVAGDSIVTGPGYRVQVFASGSRQAAESFRMDAEIRLGVRAYVEELGGMLKVRVGDCRSRRQADDLMQRCRAVGYTDAWIVSSEIRWRPPAP